MTGTDLFLATLEQACLCQYFIWISGVQTCEAVSFWFLNYSICSPLLWQPRETNTLYHPLFVDGDNKEPLAHRLA